MLTLSLLFHLILILPLFILSLRSTTLIFYSPVYSVDLVGSKEVTAVSGKKGKVKKGYLSAKSRRKVERKRKREAEALRKRVATLKKMQALEERQAMEALKTRIEALRAKKSGKIVKQKLAEIEKKKKEREKTARLIKEMEEKIKSLKASVQERGESVKGKTGEREENSSPSRGKGNMSIPPEIKAYLNALDQRVRKSWIVPKALIENREDLMVQLRIIIENDGGVSSIVVERPSGNRNFDESVLRAIKRSSPLPTPPEILREENDYFEVGLRFHYFKES